MFIFCWLSQTWPLTLRIQEYVISGCTVPLDSKEIKLGSSDQETSPSAGKNITVVLSAMFTNFSVKGYLPLIQKDFCNHMHGLAVYVKERLPFVSDLSLENSADSSLCFRLALLHSMSYSFFSIDYLLRLCAQFLILFHLT